MVLDRAIDQLIDANQEYEIKYKHTLLDQIPVYKTQGKVAAMTENMLDFGRALVATAQMQSKLMDYIANATTTLSYDAFNLLTTQLTDIGQLQSYKDKLDAAEEDLDAKRREFARIENRMKQETPQGPTVLDSPI
jgi:hypothetical protein